MVMVAGFRKEKEKKTQVLTCWMRMIFVFMCDEEDGTVYLLDEHGDDGDEKDVSGLVPILEDEED